MRTKGWTAEDQNARGATTTDTKKVKMTEELVRLQLSGPPGHCPQKAQATGEDPGLQKREGKCQPQLKKKNKANTLYKNK